ncbi:carbamoyl-phosphate synthase small subunit [Bartonella sp. AR 15-3]|nr:carbamoyl-phosphate synthase small subunit [Bartonella sp. AR 15-3]
MTQTISLPCPWSTNKPTALLVLADGTVIEGKGAGATGTVEAEVCFNTAITGYEEILTDPSYTGQIINFTFPHIGNVGANREDIEDLTPSIIMAQLVLFSKQILRALPITVHMKI